MNILTEFTVLAASSGAVLGYVAFSLKHRKIHSRLKTTSLLNANLNAACIDRDHKISNLQAELVEARRQLGRATGQARADAIDFSQQLRALQEELFPLRVKEQLRLSRLRAAGAKGKATQIAAAKAKRAAKVSATATALATTTFRPRNEVVDGVVEQRKRRQHDQAQAGAA